MVRRIPIQFSAAPANHGLEPDRPAREEQPKKSGNINPLSLVPQAEQDPVVQAVAETEDTSRRELERALAQVEQMARDLRNYKRHAEAQLAGAYQAAREDVLAELGDAVLSLEQATQMVDQDPEAVRQGVALVARGIQTVFDRHGLERIPTVGHAFDPTLHEAVLVEQAPREMAKGTIVREISPGFRSAQRVVRPAKVSVCG